jgi:hypothetical protein
MKISKTHKSFARRLNNPYFINYPERYLGPNGEAVINFWLYLETLSKDQLKVVRDRYLALSQEDRNVAYGRVSNAVQATTKYDKYAGYAAYVAIRGVYSSFFVYSAADYATEELIGLDKLLELGHKPVFFPMFLNL